MPKVRDHRRPAAQQLVVSPWQTKREDSGEPAAAPDAPCMYSVVTSESLLSVGPLVQPTATALGSPCSGQVVPVPLQLPQSQQQQQQHEAGWHQRQKRSQLQLIPAYPPPSAAAASFDATAQPAMQLQLLDPTTPPRSSFSLQQQHQQQQQQKEQEQQVQGLQQQQPQHTDAADDSPAEETEEPELTESDSAAEQQQQHSTEAEGLHGVAQLVLHPSGAIFGHFVATTSSSSSSDSSSHTLCLALKGQQVLGLHSCYRDPEWALLQLSIIRFSSEYRVNNNNNNSSSTRAHQQQQQGGDALPQGSDQQQQQQQHGWDPFGSPQEAAAGAVGVAAAAAAAAAAASGGSEADQAEAVAWVQRTGGDLARLEPADMDDEDTEAAILADNLGVEPANVQVNFTPHTLLAGPGAAERVLKAWPALADVPGVVVNLGDMSIQGLPVGFLEK